MKKEVRDAGENDKELMEFEINPTKGMQIPGPFEGVENLLAPGAGPARRIEMGFGEYEAESEFTRECKRGRI